MAGSVDISIQGLNQFLDRLKRAPKTLQDEVGRELKDGADAIVQRAKRKLSSNKTTDEGTLSRGISRVDKGPLEYEVVSAAKHSPYIEWGTKRRVSVPAELSAYAATFKGKGGGTFAEFLKAMLSWVRRKGIRFDSASRFKSGPKKGRNRQLTYEQTANMIALYILYNGIKPQPFFFNSVKEEEPNIIKHVEDVLKDIL